MHATESNWCAGSRRWSPQRNEVSRLVRCFEMRRATPALFGSILNSGGCLARSYCKNSRHRHLSNREARDEVPSYLVSTWEDSDSNRKVRLTPCSVLRRMNVDIGPTAPSCPERMLVPILVIVQPCCQPASPSSSLLLPSTSPCLSRRPTQHHSHRLSVAYATLKKFWIPFV